MIISHFKKLSVSRGSKKQLSLKFIPVKVQGDTKKDRKKAKESVPQWSPAHFRGDYRKKSNFLYSQAMVLDFDNDCSDDVMMRLENFTLIVKGSGLHCIIHTSFSHSPDKHKFRAIFPLSEPAWRSQLKACYDRLLFSLGMDDYMDSIDSKSFELAQVWLYPSYPKGTNNHNILEVEGKPFETPEIPIHEALPEIRFTDIDIEALLLCKDLKICDQGASDQGYISCECPWEVHEDGLKAAFKPSRDKKWPEIKCFTEKCSGRGLREFLELFEPASLVPSQPGNDYDFPDLSHKGVPLATYDNFLSLLVGLRIKLYRDEVLKLDYIQDAHDPAERITDFHFENLIQESLRVNFKIRSSASSMVSATLSQNQENPIRDWIKDKPWDERRDYIGDLFETLKVNTDIVESQPGFYRMLFEKWLVSCVANQFETHPFSKGVLVLQGEQSVGKTTWVRSLLPPDLQEYVATGVILDPANKDSVMHAISSFICELGELDGTFKRADIAKLKAFVTLTEDRMRIPYARAQTFFKRRTTFIATVNKQDFLQDDTGQSRWWTIPVTRCEFDHKIPTQQVFSQAYFLYKNLHKDSKSWLLSQADTTMLEGAAEEFQPVGAYEDDILRIFDFGSGVFENKIGISEIYEEITGKRGCDKSESSKLSNTLRKLGVKTGRVRHGQARNRVWLMPPKNLPPTLNNQPLIGQFGAK